MRDKFFKEILYRVDNWLKEGSGWVIELMETEYVNISVYSALSGSTYIKLPHKLRNSVKCLINIKNNDNKCFLLCHIKHLNPLKIHSERIAKEDKNTINDLDYEGIKMPVSKQDFSRLEKKNNTCINVFCHENELAFPVYISDQKYENCMDLLLTTKENKSHYVYIKDFNRSVCNETKNKNKKHF